MVNGKFQDAVIIFISPDVKKTAKYYRDVFSCKVVEHYENEEPFAALYRDNIEIVVVKAKKEKVISNRERYGAGYDAYLDPENIDMVGALHRELKEKGAEIAVEPRLTPYGSYEFVVKDIDGRLIGIGLVKDQKTFFNSSENGIS